MYQLGWYSFKTIFGGFQDGFDEDAPVNGEQPDAPVRTEPETETSDTEDPNAPMNEEGAEIESDVDTSINGTTKKIRQKLTHAGVDYVQTVWGVGYKFEVAS